MKRLLAAAVLLAAPAYAQTPASGVATTMAAWQRFGDYIVKSAEQMPESNYSYQPISTVRTFGQLIGHVAGAQFTFCAAAMGEAPKAEDDIEKSVTSKAGLVAALKSSNDYCRKAYGQTDAQASAMTKLFGSDQSRMSALVLNATHIAEHYGNIVTYFRMKGMVPPSSQPQPGS